MSDDVEGGRIHRRATIQFCILASGSSGNAAIVASGRTRLLIDGGLSAFELTRRLSRFDLKITDLDGIVVTHEHGDHVAGLSALAGRWGRTIYLTSGTRRALRLVPNGSRMVEIEAGRPFSIGEVRVTPFPLSHDAAEPVGFTFEDGIGKVGYATDLGCVTPAVRDGLAGCRILVIEFNHDHEMLTRGPYPAHLKRRILSERGHLANDDSASLLRSSMHDGLEWVFLAHLSRTNNHPDLAYDVARTAVSGVPGNPIHLCVAEQGKPGPWVRLDKTKALW